MSNEKNEELKGKIERELPLVDDLLAEAKQAEIEGELDLAVSLYNRVLAVDGEHREVLRGLGELRRDMGDTDRARRCFEKLAAYGDEGAKACLTELRGDAVEPDTKQRKKREEVDFQESRGAAPTDSDLIMFADLFSGREGVHARQWKSLDGRCGYSPIHRHLTPALVRQHLLGAATLGVYVVKRDNTCSLLAFDVDTRADLLDLELGERKSLLRDAATAASRIASTARGLGMGCLVEESGNKGRHVWVFFDEPWPAWKARRLGRGILPAAGSLPAGISVEVFPAQGRVRQGGLGNLIKLPCGIHLKSDRPSRLIERDGSICEEPFRLLAEVSRVPTELLEEALEKLSSDTVEDADRPVDTETIVERDPEVEGEKVARHARPQAVPDDEYDPDSDEELAFLTARCPVIEALVTTARQKNLLSHDERAALTYTIGHLTDGPRAVNHLLAEAGYEEMPLKSRLRGNPSSCSRIRSRLGIGRGERGCDCSFDETLGSYPHPLLHLASLASEQRASALGEKIDPGARVSIERDLELAEREIERLSRIAAVLRSRLASVAAGGSAEIAQPVKVIPISGKKDRASGEG